MRSPGFSFRLRGFTLIEMMVSLVIIAMLTIVLLWNYPETSVRLTLANMTHAVSLLIREAQVRGSAVDSANSSVGGYGVYLAMATPASAILFNDFVNSAVAMPYNIPIGDGLYETSPINETKTTVTLSPGYYISKLCVGTGFPFTCNTANNPPISTLTISFTRPIPLPAIYVNGSSATSYPGACIELRSPRAPLSGHIRMIQVFNSGMIRTDVGKCDNTP